MGLRNAVAIKVGPMHGSYENQKSSVSRVQMDTIVEKKEGAVGLGRLRVGDDGALALGAVSMEHAMLRGCTVPAKTLLILVNGNESRSFVGISVEREESKGKRRQRTPGQGRLELCRSRQRLP